MRDELALWKDNVAALLDAAARSDVEALLRGVEQQDAVIGRLEAAGRSLDAAASRDFAECHRQLEGAVTALHEMIATELREVRAVRGKLRVAGGGRSRLKSVRV